MAVAAECTGSAERQPRFRGGCRPRFRTSCETVRMFWSQRSRPWEARKEADPIDKARGNRDPRRFRAASTKPLSQTLVGVYYE